MFDASAPLAEMVAAWNAIKTVIFKKNCGLKVIRKE